MNLLFYGMWCGIRFYFPMCFFMSIYVNRFESGAFDHAVVFVVKKERESLDVFSIFVVEPVKNREVTLVFCISEIFRNL